MTETRRSHLFGPSRFPLLHLVGLHLGLQFLPVLADGALLGAHPAGVLAGFADGGDVADALLGRWLHGLTCRTESVIGFSMRDGVFLTLDQRWSGPSEGSTKHSTFVACLNSNKQPFCVLFKSTQRCFHVVKFAQAPVFTSDDSSRRFSSSFSVFFFLPGVLLNINPREKKLSSNRWSKQCERPSGPTQHVVSDNRALVGVEGWRGGSGRGASLENDANSRGSGLL